MHHARTWRLSIALGLIAAGAILPASSCSFNNVLGFVRDYNPCGTVIDCTAVGGAAGYRFLTSGYEGPGINAKIDPACTYPPYCNVYNPGSDPFSP